MNIAFVGSPQISAKILEKLHKDGFNIPLVISQPDKRKKRGQSVDLSEEDRLTRDRLKHRLSFDPVHLWFPIGMFFLWVFLFYRSLS